jgi:hypothetical protein
MDHLHCTQEQHRELDKIQGRQVGWDIQRWLPDHRWNRMMLHLGVLLDLVDLFGPLVLLVRDLLVVLVDPFLLLVQMVLALLVLPAVLVVPLVLGFPLMVLLVLRHLDNSSL